MATRARGGSRDIEAHDRPRPCICPARTTLCAAGVDGFRPQRLTSCLSSGRLLGFRRTAPYGCRGFEDLVLQMLLRRQAADGCNAWRESAIDASPTCLRDSWNRQGWLMFELLSVKINGAPAGSREAQQLPRPCCSRIVRAGYPSPESRGCALRHGVCFECRAVVNGYRIVGLARFCASRT